MNKNQDIKETRNNPKNNAVIEENAIIKNFEQI